jgi:hypothetical protein
MNTTTAETQPQRSPLKLLIGVLARPGSTMRYLREAKRRWWIVPAVLMMAALVFHGFALARANAEYVYQQQLDWFASMPQEQRGPMSEPPPKATPPLLTTAIPIAGRALVTAVGWLVWAGLLYLAGTFFGSNDVKYGPLFAMTVWAWVPYAIRNALQGLVMTLTGRPIYNQGLSGLVLDSAPPPPMAMALSGRYIPPSRGEQVLAGLLARIDVYFVWNLALIIVGVAVFERLPRKKAAPIAIGIWLLATALGLLPKIIGLNQNIRIF